VVVRVGLRKGGRSKMAGGTETGGVVMEPEYVQENIKALRGDVRNNLDEAMERDERLKEEHAARIARLTGGKVRFDWQDIPLSGVETCNVCRPDGGEPIGNITLQYNPNSEFLDYYARIIISDGDVDGVIYSGLHTFVRRLKTDLDNVRDLAEKMVMPIGGYELAEDEGGKK